VENEKTTENGQEQERHEEVAAAPADATAGPGDGTESATVEDTAAGAEDGNDPALESTAAFAEQLAEAEAKAAEYLDGWQRARAEFANARKRLERERIESRRKATIDVAARLLPVLDDFQRAIENAPAAVADDSWFEGIALVHRKLVGILEEIGIEPIKALGEPFDPNVHEAVLQEESDAFESGTVCKELQTGYRMGERVIRPAMVVVAA
jgi:molecular chaperone GrpE